MPRNSALMERPMPASRGISYAPSSLPLLTEPNVTLLDSFLNTLAGVPQAHVTRTEVHGWHDPEEDTAQVIVRQWVSLSAPEMADRLEVIGWAVEAWMGTLPTENKTARVATG